jgi:hypothetical protein
MRVQLLNKTYADICDLDFAAGSGKTILWYDAFPRFSLLVLNYR